MDLRLLGDVRVAADDRVVPLPRSGERCVLATLAFNPGRPIHIDTLIENVWGDRRPDMAEQTIATYLRAVRRALAEAGGARDWLVNRRPRAYELRVAPELIDYQRFVSHATAGRTLADQGDHDGAIVRYRHALDLWDGDPLADLTGDWAEWRRHALQQEHLDVLCRMFDAQILIGDCAAVANHANQLMGEIVPTERLIKLAILGLAGCGQKSLIPEFLGRADRRMHEATGTRIGKHIYRMAHQLASDPTAESNRSAERRPDESASGRQPDSEVAGPPASRNKVATDAEEAPKGALRTAETVGRDGHRGEVNMTAMFNGSVVQVAGDQYIVDNGPVVCTENNPSPDVG